MNLPSSFSSPNAALKLCTCQKSILDNIMLEVDTFGFQNWSKTTQDPKREEVSNLMKRSMQPQIPMFELNPHCNSFSTKRMSKNLQTFVTRKVAPLHYNKKLMSLPQFWSSLFDRQICNEQYVNMPVNWKEIILNLNHACRCKHKMISQSCTKLKSPGFHPLDLCSWIPGSSSRMSCPPEGRYRVRDAIHHEIQNNTNNKFGIQKPKTWKSSKYPSFLFRDGSRLLLPALPRHESHHKDDSWTPIPRSPLLAGKEITHHKTKLWRHLRK